MPLTLKLKQLRLKMATMQSSRTQCCCCAIGVFAALFGIFMLSAGICIVLNVNYMEVDTSGLPPELHNEDGKKVVGIILICVALGALGLSVTVSIMYFALCNQKPRRAIVSTSSGGPGTEGAANTTSRAHQNGHSSRSSSHQRASDTNRNSSDSQLSINSLPRQRRQSPSLAPARGATGLRKKTQIQKAKNHRIRHPRYHTGLSPHIEEPETAKSQVDLKLHQNRSTDTKSGGPHQNNTDHGQSSSTSFSVDEPGLASASGTSFSEQPSTSANPPIIVINGSDSSHLHHSHSKTSHSQSAEPPTLTNSTDMSFSDANMGESLMLTEESTLFDEVDTDEPASSHLYSSSELQQNSSGILVVETASYSKSDSYGNNSDNTNQREDTVTRNHSHPHSSSDIPDSIPESDDHAHPVSTSPVSMIPSRVDIVDEVEQGSLDSYSHNVVRVKPKDNNMDLTSITSYPESTISYPNPSSSNSNSDPAHSKLDKEQFAQLPPSSRHHDMYTDFNDNNHINTDNERRCESQSSFNSAFSNDGGDPGDEDMKRMREKMRELLN